MYGTCSTTILSLPGALGGTSARRDAQGDHNGQRASNANPAVRTADPTILPLRNADEVVGQLREKLERYRRRRAKQAGWTRRFVPTGLAPLDALLPHGGLPCGAITEMYADQPGLGSMTLAMRVVGRRDEGKQSDEATKRRSDEEKESRERDKGTKGRRDGDEGSKNQNKSPVSSPMSLRRFVAPSLPVVFIDTHGDFYPPAAEAFGISLDRLIVLRVRRAKDALWATEQSLRSPAVGAVIAPLNDLDERDSRRLQLAAERSGCLGLILRPAHRRAKSFAAVQMLLESDGGWHGQTCLPVQDTTGVMAHAQRDHVGPAVRTTRRDKGTQGRRDEDWGIAAGWEHGRSLNRENEHLSLRDGYRCRITLLAVREGMPTSPCQVDLYHETGTGDLPPLPVDRSMAKTG